MTASYNSMNQIATFGGPGLTRVAVHLDETGLVSIGIAGQGETTGDAEVSGEIGRMPNPKGEISDRRETDSRKGCPKGSQSESTGSERVKPARMVAENRFDADFDLLPAGTSTLAVEAVDQSGNQTTKRYSVATSPQKPSIFSYDLDGNLLSDGVRTYEWDTLSR